MQSANSDPRDINKLVSRVDQLEKTVNSLQGRPGLIQATYNSIKSNATMLFSKFKRGGGQHATGEHAAVKHKLIWVITDKLNTQNSQFNHKGLLAYILQSVDPARQSSIEYETCTSFEKVEEIVLAQRQSHPELPPPLVLVPVMYTGSRITETIDASFCEKALGAKDHVYMFFVFIRLGRDDGHTSKPIEMQEIGDYSRYFCNFTARPVNSHGEIFWERAQNCIRECPRNQAELANIAACIKDHFFRDM